MASPDIEVFGKAASGSGSPSDVRGDCPFSQRIYIDLEEKRIPYKATYIEEGENKPQWFMEHNPKGLMPVLRDGDQWIQDSDKIAKHLEEKFPEPSLAAPEDLQQYSMSLFQSFTSWLKAKDPNSPEKEKYVEELRKLNEHLETKGPFVAGEKFTDADANLIPKFLHAKVALEHYYNFHVPTEFKALHKYFETVTNRDSFKKTTVPSDMIVEGWQKKFELPGKMVGQSQ
jgi:glutathione S-transferase